MITFQFLEEDAEWNTIMPIIEDIRRLDIPSLFIGRDNSEFWIGVGNEAAGVDQEGHYYRHDFFSSCHGHVNYKTSVILTINDFIKWYIEQ